MFGPQNDSMMAAASDVAHPSNPFYPIGVEVVGYLANKWSVPALLGIFLGGWVVILGVSWFSVGWISPKLRQMDKLVVLWFILSKFDSIRAVMMSQTDSAESWCYPFLLRRLFCSESCEYGACPRLIWPVMERICSLRLEIPHFRPFCIVHGVCHRGMGLA